jgi:hypothetical protein
MPPDHKPGDQALANRRALQAVPESRLPCTGGDFSAVSARLLVEKMPGAAYHQCFALAFNGADSLQRFTFWLTTSTD